MKLLIVNDAVLELNSMKDNIPWDLYGIDEVFAAYCAEEAKALLASNRVDIMLCDIEMPGENGLELIRWVNDNGYDIDTILLTCHADFDYAREAVSLNCLEYVLLPAKYEDIGQAVAKACTARRVRQKEKRLRDYGQSWLKERSPEAAEPSDYKHTTLVENCIHYIIQNIGDEDLSVSMIADHLHMNPTYLNRIFKKEKGISLSQWIIQERMELAAELLKNPANSAISVASQVGYSNYPYFSTTFKRYHHCTPSQYTEK